MRYNEVTKLKGDVDMIEHLEKFMLNLRQYIEISNESFDHLSKEEIFEKINHRNCIFKSIYKDNQKNMALVLEELVPSMTREKFLEYQQYANKLYTLKNQLDCPTASVIHRKLKDIAFEWKDDNLYLQECYYLGSVYYTFDPAFFTPQRRALYAVAQEYKDKYFSLDKKTREIFLRLYGNICMTIRQKDRKDKDQVLTEALAFREEYYRFLDRKDVRDLDPDFQFDVYKFSVDSNIAIYISDLRYGHSFSEANFKILKEIIEGQYLERLELCKQTSSPIPDNYEQRYYSIKFFNNEITIDEWVKRMKAIVNRYISNSELSLQSLNSIFFIETLYLTILERFSDISEYDLKQTLDEVKLNCFNYLTRIKKDENTVVAYNQYIKFCIGLREVKAGGTDIKNSFLNLVRFQSPETYVHIQSVSRISEIICDALYKKQPELFIGCLDTKDLNEVKRKYEKIRSVLYDGALLHDTGKSSYLFQVSNYYRPLTDEEYLLIKNHPVKSYEFLYSSFEEPILEIALYHHVWHDHVYGYPLSDNMVIKNQLLVDIVSVADSIDAATDTIGRTYAYPKTFEDLMKELYLEAGTRYSKEVLDVIDVEVSESISNIIHDFKYKVFASIIDRSKNTVEIKKLSVEYKYNSFMKSLEKEHEKKKITDELYDILLEYARVPHTLTAIRNYVLANINLIDSNVVIQKFRKLSTLISDDLGIALSYIFEVWTLYSSDLSKAQSANERAFSYLKKVPEYDKTEVYLSYSNNCIILANASGDLKKSYQTASRAYRLLDDTSQLQYLVAFSYNYVYVLMELGLNQKAFDIIQNNRHRKDLLSKYNDTNNLYLYTVTCLGNNYGKEAYVSSKKLIDVAQSTGVISLNISYGCLLESALSLKNAKLIEDAFRRLEEYRKTNTEDKQDIFVAYEAFAHYYMYQKNYELAYDYYLKLEPHIDSIFGSRKRRYEELICICRIMEDTQRVAIYQEKLVERLLIINDILSELAAHPQDDLSDVVSKNTYQALFENADKMVGFISSILTTFDLFEINRLIQGYVGQHLHFKRCNLYFINEKQACMCIHENSFEEVDSKNEISKLALIQKKPIIFSLGQVNTKLKKIFELEKLNHLIILPLYNSNVHVGFLSIECDDLSEYNQYQTQIRGIIFYVAQALANVQNHLKAVFNSNIDYLTRVNNRFGLDLQIQQYFKQNVNDYYIVMIDIDFFKSINDRYGHICGDKVLVELSKKLVQYFEAPNVARMGGEEFVVIYFGDYAGICEQLQQLKSDINATLIEHENEYINYTISMGAIKMEGFANFYKGYSLADDLLYQAKENGRNQFVIEKPEKERL